MKKSTAFTLVELMVAMAIIGVLIGLAIFGVSAAQRAQRDTTRRSTAQDINVGIQDYYDRNGRYPDFANYTGGFLYLSRSTSCSAPSNTCVAVPLKGIAIPVGSGLSGSFASAQLNIGDVSMANNTRYCLRVVSDGIVVGAYLETQTWINVGSSATQQCT